MCKYSSRDGFEQDGSFGVCLCLAVQRERVVMRVQSRLKIIKKLVNYSSVRLYTLSCLLFLVLFGQLLDVFSFFVSSICAEKSHWAQVHRIQYTGPFSAEAADLLQTL
ncbi:hypothetical protein ABZP36_008403 [Zizania latifolia]